MKLLLKELNILALEYNFKIEKFDPEVLREYDIRGIVGKNLTNNTAYTIGRTFGHLVQTITNSNIIIVGYDGRLTSEKLYNALCEGLKKSGINVLSIGMGPTPMTYFAHHHLNSDAAIMITGSHNPPEYNGFKMVINNNSFFGSNIYKLQDLVKKGKLKEGLGKIENIDISEQYVGYNIKNINLLKKLKIAWDIGNGAVGAVIKKFINNISNAEHILINEDVDGNFPNHHPDPTVPKNMQQLISIVKDEKCDLGVAFDGDGDRLGVVDNKGNIVWADQYMILLSKEIASLYKNPKIIMDVKCSKIFFDEIKKIGCNPIMYKTGHSPLKEKMKELKSPLSGEMSGHVCYGDDFYGYDDAIYVALRLFRILSKEQKSLSNLISEYPVTISTPETRIDVDEKRKFKIVEEIKKRLTDFDGELIDIDGIRVQNDKGWFLIRASNTQNQLTCRAEALNNNNLLYFINFIEEQLKLSGVNYSFNNE